MVDCHNHSITPMTSSLTLMVGNRDTGYDFTGKRVAVIGNGSSAIQIVPELQKVAGHLSNYMRSPTWISAGYSSEFTLTSDGKNFKCIPTLSLSRLGHH